jgi:hypothetical protein
MKVKDNGIGIPKRIKLTSSEGFTEQAMQMAQKAMALICAW